MSATKIEFAVQMSCNSCVEAVKNSLEAPQIKILDIDLEKSTVVVETSLSTIEVLDKIRSSGRKVVVKGYESILAGVAVLDTGDANVQGVVRFVQLPQTCIIDGTVDGLRPGHHKLSVHECGDLSNGCQSVGDFFNSSDSDKKHNYGNLGSVVAEGENGRAVFRFEDSLFKLSDVIGRSLVISDINNDSRVSCGIIARSAGLFQNPKTICACDGISIWNETLPKKSVL